MNNKSLSPYLRNSRSRHERVVSPELQRASILWRKEKKERESLDYEVQKVTRQLKYYEQLNRRLSQGINTKKKEYKQAHSVRQRYIKGLQHKEDLDRLRQSQISKNQSIVERTKEDRVKRDLQVQRHLRKKAEVASFNRSESRSLLEEKRFNDARTLYKNKEKVGTIYDFECRLKESFIRQKQMQNNKFLCKYRGAIQHQEQIIKTRRQESIKLKDRIRSLTESNTGKLAELSHINQSIRSLKRNLPPLPGTTTAKKRMSINDRCYTHEATSTDDLPPGDRSVFISQHYGDI